MFKTDSFLGNKKLSLNQNVWRDHATMQQDILLHFWVIFHFEIRLKYEKIFCCPALELFHCLPLWTTVRLHGKKIQNATNQFTVKQSKTLLTW